MQGEGAADGVIGMLYSLFPPPPVWWSSQCCSSSPARPSARNHRSCPVWALQKDRKRAEVAENVLEEKNGQMRRLLNEIKGRVDREKGNDQKCFDRMEDAEGDKGHRKQVEQKKKRLMQMQWFSWGCVNCFLKLGISLQQHFGRRWTDIIYHPYRRWTHTMLKISVVWWYHVYIYLLLLRFMYWSNSSVDFLVWNWWTLIK